MKIKNRLLWADILRILAIYLVVVLHSSLLPFNTSSDLTIAWPFIVSYAFAETCVPIFVMLSGALLLGKTETYQIFFKKRVNKVLIPWVIWTLIYMLWNYNFHHQVASTVSEWKYFFEVTFLSQLWFLPLIFSLYLITPFLRFVASKLKVVDKVYLIVIWFIWVSILPALHSSPAFPGQLTLGLLPLAIYYSGYFFTGYILSKLKFSKKMILFSLGMVIVGILFSFVEIFSAKNRALDLIYIITYFSPGTVIATIGVFSFINNLFRNSFTVKNAGLRSLIISLSRASLGIYIVHELLKEIFDIYLNKYLLSYFVALPLLETYVHALIIFIISFIFVYLLKKVPLLRQIVP
jgi:surface polysaccharide O-acyltransferase-like enzyme